MNFPTLYKKTSTGAIQQWSIEANPDGYLDAVIVTTYGKQGGKMQTATDYLREGKNVGKVNETTAEEQAVAEAQSQWEKKKKKGYVETVEEAQADQVDSTYVAGGVSPMLAHKYHEQGHKIKFPAFVQPKLDGHRCIAIWENGRCTLWSRTQKRINSVPHIERAIEKMMEGSPRAILDGELYNHDYRHNFDELSSLIRKSTPQPGHEKVHFYIYDIVLPAPFGERAEYLAMIDAKAEKPIYVVATDLLESEEQMTTVFGAYVTEGFEGLMVRNAAGVYKNKRSYDLQKVKLFDDAEFEVVGIDQGRGKMAGKAIFECATESGDTFTCVMKGTLEEREHYFNNPDLYINKMLTVQYQGLSNKGIPRFPVALRFRKDV